VPCTGEPSYTNICTQACFDGGCGFCYSKTDGTTFCSGSAQFRCTECDCDADCPEDYVCINGYQGMDGQKPVTTVCATVSLRSACVDPGSICLPE
jgi:hypothetical protein